MTRIGCRTTGQVLLTEGTEGGREIGGNPTTTRAASVNDRKIKNQSFAPAYRGQRANPSRTEGGSISPHLFPFYGFHSSVCLLYGLHLAYAGRGADRSLDYENRPTDRPTGRVSIYLSIYIYIYIYTYIHT